MDLSNLHSSLLERGRKEAEQIVTGAEKEAQEILAEAKRKEEALVKEAQEKAAKEAEALRRERLSWASLEARKIEAAGRERALESAFEKIKKGAEKFRKSKEYVQFLKNAAERAVKELGKEAVLHVAKGDRKHLKGFKVKEDLKDDVGLVAEKEGVRLLFTFSALMEEKEDLLRRMVLKELGL